MCHHCVMMIYTLYFFVLSRIKYTEEIMYFLSLERRIVKNDVYCVLVKMLKCSCTRKLLWTTFPDEINKKNTNYADIIKPLRNDNRHIPYIILIKPRNKKPFVVFFSVENNIYFATRNRQTTMIITRYAYLFQVLWLSKNKFCENSSEFVRVLYLQSGIQIIFIFNHKSETKMWQIKP